MRSGPGSGSHPSREPSRVQSNAGKMPYHSYADEVVRFVEVLYEVGFIWAFDWPSWQKDAERYYDDPMALARADLTTICKLLTVHVRKNRFSEGHLAVMVEKGHIAAILRRLRELREWS